jgi:hypothetical protein
MNNYTNRIIKMKYYSYKYTILVVFMKEKYLKLSSRRCLGMMMIQKKALLSKDLRFKNGGADGTRTHDL